MNWQKFKFVQILTSHLIKLLGTYQTCGSFNTSMGTCTPRALLLNIAKGGGKFSAWVLLCVQLRVSYWWGALTSLETTIVLLLEKERRASSVVRRSVIVHLNMTNWTRKIEQYSNSSLFYWPDIHFNKKSIAQIVNWTMVHLTKNATLSRPNWTCTNGTKVI